MDQIFVVDPHRNALKQFVDNLNANASEFGIPGGVNLGNANIQPYIIRAHQKLAAGTNLYDFDLKNNSSGQLSIEKKLVEGDIFQALGMALCIQKYDAAAPDFSTQLMTSPDPTYFPDAEAKCLELIYNGKTQFMTDSTNRISELDNTLFRVSQRGVFTGTLAAPVTNPTYGPGFENRGFYMFAGYPIIQGKKTNRVSVSLAQGSSAGIAGTGADANNLVVLIYGFRFSGITMGGPGGCQI